MNYIFETDGWSFFFIFQKNLLCPLNYPPVQLGHQTKEQILFDHRLVKNGQISYSDGFERSFLQSFYIIQVKNYETFFSPKARIQLSETTYPRSSTKLYLGWDAFLVPPIII